MLRLTGSLPKLSLITVVPPEEKTNLVRTRVVVFMLSYQLLSRIYTRLRGIVIQKSESCKDQGYGRGGTPIFTGVF